MYTMHVWWKSPRFRTHPPTHSTSRQKDSTTILSAVLLVDALDSEEPKVAVIELLLHRPAESAAPEQEQEPQSQPQRQVAPTQSSSGVNSRPHHVYTTENYIQRR